MQEGENDMMDHTVKVLKAKPQHASAALQVAVGWRGKHFQTGRRPFFIVTRTSLSRHPEIKTRLHALLRKMTPGKVTGELRTTKLKERNG